MARGDGKHPRIGSPSGADGFGTDGRRRRGGHARRHKRDNQGEGDGSTRPARRCEHSASMTKKGSDEKRRGSSNRQRWPCCRLRVVPATESMTRAAQDLAGACWSLPEEDRLDIGRRGLLAKLAARSIPIGRQPGLRSWTADRRQRPQSHLADEDWPAVRARILTAPRARTSIPRSCEVSRDAALRRRIAAFLRRFRSRHGARTSCSKRTQRIRASSSRRSATVSPSTRRA